MTNFEGHIVPGGFFIFYSIWLAIHLFSRYYRSIIRGQNPVKWRKSGHNEEILCQGSYRLQMFGKLPMEGFVKMALASCVLTGEWYLAKTENGSFVHLENPQHMIIMFFFGINGLADVLLTCSRLTPKGLDYATFAMAFFIECVVFTFHLHARSSLDIQIHRFLLLTAGMCFVSCLVEWRHRKAVLAGLFRSFCIGLQGTWLCYTGFVLYNPFRPKPNFEDHAAVMMVTTYFGCHIIVIMFYIYMTGFIVSLWHRKRRYEYDSSRYMDFCDSDPLTSRAASIEEQEGT